MLNLISKKSGLAALAIGAMTLLGATAASVAPAAAGHGWGGGHGHWGSGHGHWGGHGRWGWGGPRFVVGGPVFVGRYRDCYSVRRTVYIPGEGYARVRSRVCD